MRFRGSRDARIGRFGQALGPVLRHASIVVENRVRVLSSKVSIPVVIFGGRRHQSGNRTRTVVPLPSPSLSSCSEPPCPSATRRAT